MSESQDVPQSSLCGIAQQAVQMCSSLTHPRTKMWGVAEELTVYTPSRNGFGRVGGWKKMEKILLLTSRRKNWKEVSWGRGVGGGTLPGDSPSDQDAFPSESGLLNTMSMDNLVQAHWGLFRHFILPHSIPNLGFTHPSTMAHQENKGRKELTRAVINS